MCDDSRSMTAINSMSMSMSTSRAGKRINWFLVTLVWMNERGKEERVKLQNVNLLRQHCKRILQLVVEYGSTGADRVREHSTAQWVYCTIFILIKHFDCFNLKVLNESIISHLQKIWFVTCPVLAGYLTYLPSAILSQTFIRTAVMDVATPD